MNNEAISISSISAAGLNTAEVSFCVGSFSLLNFFCEAKNIVVCCCQSGHKRIVVLNCGTAVNIAVKTYKKLNALHKNNF